MILRVAWRNTWRNPRRTAIVAVSVAVGIWGCVLSMALNLGFMKGMVDTAIATGLGHVQVHATGYEKDQELRIRLVDGGADATAALAQMDEIKAWSVRLRGQGLVNSPRASVGVGVLGIDPAREGNVSVLRDSLVEGEWVGETPRRILIGEAMAERLQVKVGNKIVLSVQDLAGELTGQGFRVGGLFHSPSAEIDKNVVLLSLGEAQSLFDVGQAVTEVVAVARDRDDISAVVSELEASLGEGAEVRSWEQLAPLLVYMIETFDMQAWIVYAAVFVAMSFGIANVLLMSVYERAREIGMMLAMGMRRRRLVALVVVESLFVTMAGLAIGVLLSILGVWMLDDGIDMSWFVESMEALAIGNRIFPVLRGWDLVIPVVVGAVTALISSMWPAYRASKGQPADALRRV